MVIASAAADATPIICFALCRAISPKLLMKLNALTLEEEEEEDDFIFHGRSIDGSSLSLNLLFLQGSLRDKNHHWTCLPPNMLIIAFAVECTTCSGMLCMRTMHSIIYFALTCHAGAFYTKIKLYVSSSFINQGRFLVVVADLTIITPGHDHPNLATRPSLQYMVPRQFIERMPRLKIEVEEETEEMEELVDYPLEGHGDGGRITTWL